MECIRYNQFPLEPIRTDPLQRGCAESVLKLAEMDAAIAKKDLDDAIRVPNNTKTEPSKLSQIIQKM